LLDAVTADEARVLADAVGDMLVEDPTAYAAVSQPAGESWSSRSVAHQAAGMVAGQLGISAGDALAVLRSHAFASDAQLREVAREVVERRLDLSAS
jgi:ANTAR domain